MVLGVLFPSKFSIGDNPFCHCILFVMSVLNQIDPNVGLACLAIVLSTIIYGKHFYFFSFFFAFPFLVLMHCVLYLFFSSIPLFKQFCSVEVRSSPPKRRVRWSLTCLFLMYCVVSHCCLFIFICSRLVYLLFPVPSASGAISPPMNSIHNDAWWVPFILYFIWNDVKHVDINLFSLLLLWIAIDLLHV